MDEHFGKVYYEVIDSKGIYGLPASALAAYIVIVAHSSGKGKGKGTARVGHQRIADLTGITRESAARGTALLCKAGLIRVVKRGGSNAGANTYRILSKCDRGVTLQESEVCVLKRPSVTLRTSKCDAALTPTEYEQSKNREEKPEECATHTPEESGKTRRRVPPPPPARPLWMQLTELNAAKVGGVK